MLLLLLFVFLVDLGLCFVAAAVSCSYVVGVADTVVVSVVDFVGTVLVFHCCFCGCC